MQHFLLSSPEKMDKRMWSFVIDKADRWIREIGFSFYIDMVDLPFEEKSKDTMSHNFWILQIFHPVCRIE